MAPMVVKSKWSGTPRAWMARIDRRILGEVLHRGAARGRQRRDALDRVERGTPDRRGADLLPDRRQRRALVRRRQRDDVAERRERLVAGLVEAGEEHVDHHAALRVGDQVDLAPGLLTLHRAQLRGEQRGRLDDRSVGVVLRVARRRRRA